MELTMEIPSPPCLAGNRDRGRDPATISSPVSRKQAVPITVVHFVGKEGFGVVVSSSHGSSLVGRGMTPGGCPRRRVKVCCAAGSRPRGCGHCGTTRGNSGGGRAVGGTPLDAPGKPAIGISCGRCTAPLSGSLPGILSGSPAGTGRCGKAPLMSGGRRCTVGNPLRPSGGLPCCDCPGHRCGTRNLESGAG